MARCRFVEAGLQVDVTRYKLSARTGKHVLLQKTKSPGESQGDLETETVSSLIL